MQSILAGIYFIFQKIRPKPNLKGFQYQTFASLKTPGKLLSSKTNFSASLQIICCNLRLKLCQRFRVTKIVKQIKFEEFWSELEARNCFQRQ